MTDDVRQRFLNDAIRGKINRRWQWARRSDHRGLRGNACLNGRIDQHIELGQPGRRATRVDLIDAAQHLKDAPQLAQRVPARLLDGDQRLVCLIGSLRHYMGGDAGLDIDR